MFEAMAGNFAHPEDIQLFLNVLNGSMALHAGDSVILRYCMATIINATHQFKNIFNTSGYLLIMPSIVQIYSNNLSNHLVTSSIEHLVKQLYILHRKPFLLQMFGSVAEYLENTTSSFSDPFKIQPSALYRLVRSLERPTPDVINVLELVKMKKPLVSLGKVKYPCHDKNKWFLYLLRFLLHGGARPHQCAGGGGCLRDGRRL